MTKQYVIQQRNDWEWGTIGVQTARNSTEALNNWSRNRNTSFYHRMRAVTLAAVAKSDSVAYGEAMRLLAPRVAQ